MSKEQAERFAKAWGAKDPKIVEALEGGEQEGPIDLEELASIAGGMGYEFEAVELAEVLERQRAAVLEAIDVAEVSDEDLEQVAGGTIYDYGDPCSSDFDPDSRCAFSDYCLNMWNFYPLKKNCDSTYTTKERCNFVDFCMNMTNRDGCNFKELHYTY